MTLTLAEWDALPDTADHRRIECVRGELVVVPAPQGRHQLAVARLWAALDAAVPGELRALPEPDLLLVEAPLTVRNPDLVVLDADASMRDHRFPARKVHLVVEVLSPGNARTDRVVKLREYAAAGIAEYWIVDLDTPTLSQLRLSGERYGDPVVHTGAAPIDTCGVTVTIDVTALGT